jgi:hypothetical protein
MLASLRLVLATVSSHFFEHLFLRIPLIGRSPEQISQLLRLPEYQSQVTGFLRDFIAAVDGCERHPSFNLNVLKRAG